MAEYFVGVVSAVILCCASCCQNQLINNTSTLWITNAQTNDLNKYDLSNVFACKLLPSLYAVIVFI